VYRRYNHFDWLHKRLSEKYPNLCIPAIPDRAVTGNFDDEFISKRRSGLELWLNRMSHHPVIGQSEVFVHFLQSNEDKWRVGKRKAEKDEYRGSQWFCTLTVPGQSIDAANSIKDRVDRFSKSTNALDASLKNVITSFEKLESFHSGPYRKELSAIGKRLEDFGKTISAEPLDAPKNSDLSKALVVAGTAYTQIGNMYAEQSRYDLQPLLDHFTMYRGIIQQMPDIVQFEKNAIEQYDEFNRRADKLEGRDLMQIAPRLDIISHVTFAEINQFNSDKVDDIALNMRQYLQNQIKFHKEITECLEKAYASFEKIPISPNVCPLPFVAPKLSSSSTK
jgi:sorting nexin-9/18/33